MIVLYSGTPGSGKSLKCAYDMISLLNRGRNVIANFPIDLDYFKNRKGNLTIARRKFVYASNQELTVPFLKQYAKCWHVPFKEHQTTIIFDECAAMFNSRSWDMNDRMEWIFFFQQHRKLGYDVILISQHDRLIDRQIRAFIETEYKFRALKNYKTFGWFLSMVTGGLFCCVEYWYGMRLKCGSEFFRLNKKKAKIYDSFKLFE